MDTGTIRPLTDDRVLDVLERMSRWMEATDRLDTMRARHIAELEARVAGLEAREQSRQDAALVADAGRRAK